MGKNRTLSTSLVLVYSFLAVALFPTLLLFAGVDILKGFAQEDGYPITVTNETQQQALKNRFSAQSNLIETIQSTNGSIKTNIDNPTNITANSQQDLVRAITEDIKKQLQTNIDENRGNDTTVQIIDQVTGEVIRTQINSTNDTKLAEAITRWLQRGPPSGPNYTTDNSSSSPSPSNITPSILTRDKTATNNNLLNLVQFSPYYQQICDPRFSYWQPHYYGEWHQIGPGNWIYDIHWYWHYHCNGYD
jgi:hypothetical protein